MEIKIVHLYPDLLNLFGDKGNIASLEKRCVWRGINASVSEIKGDNLPDLENCDILYLGGGSETEQKQVIKKLKKIKTELKNYVENGGCLVATCGGFQMLGILEIVDVSSKISKKRASGNVVIECEIEGKKTYLTGFENHAYITDIGDLTPLGNVLEGFGNNGMGFEGINYKNVIATNLHGPVLPKNPALCDHIIKKALTKKYGEISLSPLNDNFETIASKNIISRILGEQK